MGVHGLWRLIEPSGKPVPLETLENKVLAVDVSIWLHQAIKGFQDAKGAAVPNAHLLGIYHRVCKLLYFKVKPVFVFDGGVPVLKKQTIAKRNQLKSQNLNEAGRLQKQLLDAILKHTALSNVISEKDRATLATTSKSSSSKDSQDDLYYLPPTQLNSTLEEQTETATTETSESDSSPTKNWNIHNIDTKSIHFKTLPADVRHDILTDLKETRKQSSWGKIHELPKQHDDFSVFQMNRLLKRQAVQSALEEVEKEMGGHSLSLAELESLMNDQGVVTNHQSLGTRIASDENTRFLLIKDVKLAMEQAKKDELKAQELKMKIEEEKAKELVTNNEVQEVVTNKNKGEEEYDEDLKRAIALSLEAEPSTSSAGSSTVTNNLSFLNSFTDGDFQSDSDEEPEEVSLTTSKVLASAQSYMMEYSGLTPAEIAKIVGESSNKVKSSSLLKINSKEDSTSKSLKANSQSLQKIEEEKVSDLNQDLKATKQVGVMSSSSSSDDSDLEEVKSSEETSEIKTNGFHIVIQPTDQPDDDLFSDIFEEKPQEEIPKKETSITYQERSHVSISVDLDASNKKIDEQIVEEIDSAVELKTTEEPSVQIELKETLEVSGVSENVVNEVVKIKDVPKISVEEMKELKQAVQKEKDELMVEKSTKERMGANITDQMYQEAQELLELFGVPYVVAPMEAEAQCAYLNEINLTDGTITDDSDIWLFGGKTVYKNFFNQAKQVMEFRAENIEHHFKLTRQQMILLALLVGSDYTTGIQGVGPVTALEILAAFPAGKPHQLTLTHYQLLSGLKEFRKWFMQGKSPGRGRTTLRNKLKNLSFSDNFPSQQVIQAYLDPEIEPSKEPFSWGKLDVVGLQDFAKAKFGWTRTKTQEILNPVIKRLEEHRTQKTIRDFFQTQNKLIGDIVDSKLSKRVRSAINRIGTDPNEVEEGEPQPKQRRVRKTKKKSLELPVPQELQDDEEVKVLQQIAESSSQRVKDIENDVKTKLEQDTEKKKKLPDLHKKEVIPQRERDKAEMLRRKMKAIEVFRKSKQGPGFLKKRAVKKRLLKEDADLSESSDEH